MSQNRIEQGLSVLEEYLRTIEETSVPAQDARVFGCPIGLNMTSARQFYNELDKNGKSAVTGRIRETTETLKQLRNDGLGLDDLRALCGLLPKPVQWKQPAFA